MSPIYGRILKPSFNNEDFDAYAHKTLSMVEAFSMKCIEYLKNITIGFTGSPKKRAPYEP